MVNQNLMIKLSADTSNYTTKLAAASAQARSLGTALEAPRTTGQKVEGALTNIGVAAGVMAAAIGVSAVKTFAEFDAQMSLVQANTKGTTGEMGALRDAALDAGARTVYSASEAAGAINELAKAGMSTTDILNGGLNGALDLAASDGMAVSEAAELMSSTMAQFNLTGADSTRVADALAAGAGKALGSAHDLGYALAQTGTIANNYGISMEETTGTLAAFAKQGRIGSDAGTSLKSMLLRLSNQTPKVKKEMDKLGLSAYDSSGKFVGLANFAGQLQDKLSGLTPEQRDAAMAIMFGSDAVQSANILYKEGKEGIQNWTKEVSESGFAAEQAAARNDNLKGDLEQLGGAIENAFIGIGEGANDTLRGVTQTITNLVNAFADLDPRIQQTMVIITGGLGAVAGLHKIFGNLQNSTSGFGKAMGLAFDPLQRLQKGFSGFASSITTLKTLGNTSAQIDLFGGAMDRSTIKTSAASQALGGVVNLLGGPWGIAMGVAGIGLGILAKDTADAQGHSDRLTEALNSSSDAAAVLVEDLKDNAGVKFDWWHGGAEFENLKEALDEVGLSYQDMASAAMGGKTALGKFNKMMEDETGKDQNYAGRVSTRAQKIQEALTNETDAYKKAQEASKAEAEIKEQTKQKNVEATLAIAGLSTATEDNADASSEAADSSDILAEKMGATTKGVNDQASALGEVISALDTYYGFALSAFDADTKLADSFDKATESVKKNGATLDKNTEKGRENRGAISDLVDSVIASAEAHARNGESLEDVNKIMADGRQKVIDMAKAMGLSDQDAAAFADQMGLSEQSVKSLVDTVSNASDLKITINDQASGVLDKVKTKAEVLPDNKTIQISGENEQALEAIRQVTDAKIDPKTGDLLLDSTQYQVALAVANGAKIDPKTGYLLGDNTDAWKKLAEAQGWKIDPKTGVINGENGPFMAAKEAVDAAVIASKTTNINAKDNATTVIEAVRRMSVADKFFTIHGSYVDDSGGTYTRSGYRPRGAMGTIPFATGGFVSGIGTATSDSNLARLSKGEYVIRASAVNALGVDFLDHLNAAGFANGGLVKNLQAVPTAMQISMAPSSAPGFTPDMLRNTLLDVLPGVIANYTPRLGENELRRKMHKLQGVGQW